MMATGLNGGKDSIPARLHLGVGRFYNFDCGASPLTTAIGLRARVNPVGTELA